jgi:hypothetical protein
MRDQHRNKVDLSESIEAAMLEQDNDLEVITGRESDELLAKKVAHWDKVAGN